MIGKSIKRNRKEKAIQIGQVMSPGASNWGISLMTRTKDREGREEGDQGQCIHQQSLTTSIQDAQEAEMTLRWTGHLTWEIKGEEAEAWGPHLMNITITTTTGDLHQDIIMIPITIIGTTTTTITGCRHIWEAHQWEVLQEIDNTMGQGQDLQVLGIQEILETQEIWEEGPLVTCKETIEMRCQEDLPEKRSEEAWEIEAITSGMVIMEILICPEDHPEEVETCPEVAEVCLETIRICQEMRGTCTEEGLLLIAWEEVQEAEAGLLKSTWELEAEVVLHLITWDLEVVPQITWEVEEEVVHQTTWDQEVEVVHNSQAHHFQVMISLIFL
jgi:hypothetical protein